MDKTKSYEISKHQGMIRYIDYKNVGVFPNANGIGKSKIWMAKRITKA